MFLFVLLPVAGAIFKKMYTNCCQLQCHVLVFCSLFMQYCDTIAMPHPSPDRKKAGLLPSSRSINDCSAVLIKSDCCFEAVTTALSITEDVIRFSFVRSV